MQMLDSLARRSCADVVRARDGGMPWVPAKSVFFNLFQAPLSSESIHRVPTSPDQAATMVSSGKSQVAHLGPSAPVGAELVGCRCGPHEGAKLAAVAAGRAGGRSAPAGEEDGEGMSRNRAGRRRSTIEVQENGSTHYIHWSMVQSSYWKMDDVVLRLFLYMV